MTRWAYVEGREQGARWATLGRKADAEGAALDALVSEYDWHDWVTGYEAGYAAAAAPLAKAEPDDDAEQEVA